MTTAELDARELAHAIETEQLRIDVQPQVDLTTERVVAVEGLSRWTHPTLGPIPPAEFVALAESTGLIHDLGLFALRECCRIGRQWRERGFALAVAVNVSPLQLQTDRFFDELERQLGESGLAPAELIVEVTEAERIADYGTVAGRLDIIQQWGVTVSIDDFGSGHSSIERAVAVHARELKIDRTLVASGDWDQVADAVALAHEGDMRVVAEGIETAEQLNRVREVGCDRGQGFFIAKPSPPGEFIAWLQSFVG
ncbi:EAL domain-containing protein [Leifsonia poae]|uniref:EAL domain-containing protein n=1 Tax=Leifsonia poae TaxID=110933 RepID=UPI003D690120